MECCLDLLAGWIDECAWVIEVSDIKTRSSFYLCTYKYLLLHQVCYKDQVRPFGNGLAAILPCSLLNTGIVHA